MTELKRASNKIVTSVPQSRGPAGVQSYSPVATPSSPPDAYRETIRPAPDTTPALSANHFGKTITDFIGEFLAPESTLLPELQPLAPHDRTRQMLEAYTPLRKQVETFLEHHTPALQSMTKDDTLHPLVRQGAAELGHMLLSIADILDRMTAAVTGPMARCEYWQEPEMLRIISGELQFAADYLPIFDTLLTASREQRNMVPLEKYDATPLTGVVLQELLVHIALSTGDNEIAARNAGDILDRAMAHYTLLHRYQTVTVQYVSALGTLKTHVSPLVGVDAPWQGYYAPEYPDGYWGEGNYNPSTLPHEHLNEMPLQKAYRDLVGGGTWRGRPAAPEHVRKWDAVFKTLNQDSASLDIQKADVTMDAAWDTDQKQFVRWTGDPWQRLAEITARREAVIPQMMAMAKAAEAYAPPPRSPEENLQKMETAIREARKILKQMKLIWTGGGVIPSVPAYIERLREISTALDRADSTTAAAAGALRNGDLEHFRHQLLRAIRLYAGAIETPRFRSLLAQADGYQGLSFKTQMALLLVTTACGGALATAAAAGAEGALIAGGATALTVRIGTLAASGTVFGTSTALMNHAIIGEPLPQGVAGWTYEAGSNALMFGSLYKIGMRLGRPLGARLEGLAQRAMGGRSGTRLGTLSTALAGGTGRFLPTYIFFAGAWTPADMIAQQFINQNTFAPKEVWERTMSGESWKRQLVFLAALHSYNRLIEPLSKTLEARTGWGIDRHLRAASDRLSNYPKRAAERRITDYVSRDSALDQAWKTLMRPGAGNPATRLQQGAEVLMKRADLARAELDLFSLFDDTPGSVNRAAELKYGITILSDAARYVRSMSQMAAAFTQADVHPLAPGYLAYKSVAVGIIRGLGRRRDAPFILREIGDGTFVFSYMDSVGRASEEVLLIPEPTGPLSSATDMVPVSPIGK